MATHTGIKPDRLPDELLAQGVSSFDTAEAAQRMGLAREGTHAALKRLADAGEIFSPARGFYVVVPAQYRSWGAVPAARFIDPMMAHLQRNYYVGLLSAAEHFGAAHQRPQAFQVVVDRFLPSRSFGRVRIQFFVNKHTPSLPTTSANSPTGTMQVSTPEVTALDLASRPHDSAGLDNVTTVVVELHEHRPLSESGLVEVAEPYPSAAVRRLGYLLESYCGLQLDELRGFADPVGREPAPLDPSGPRRGHLDKRWNVRLNTDIEPDL